MLISFSRVQGIIISVVFNKSQRRILNKRGLSAEALETSDKMSLHKLQLLLIFTLCFLIFEI